MNKLPLATRVQILTMLCEGSSMRSISRICDVSINTVSKLLVDAGDVCARLHHENVRNVTTKRLQCDEIWSFAYTKAKNLRHAKAAPDGSGDVRTWSAIDAESKLIVSWFVGDRGHREAVMFMRDVRSRLANKVQLTTDGHRSYLSAVKHLSMDDDYAMLIKIYSPSESSGRYSPPEVVGIETKTIQGNPDPEHISTSYAERQHLTMRMSMRRFTRLTNAFSKKLENHCHALALYFFFYNWVRAHKAHKLTPAMASGLAASPMEMADVCAMIDAAERESLIAKRTAMLAPPRGLAFPPQSN